MRSTDTTVLVTGSTGFVGGHLVTELRRRGAHVVRLVRTGAAAGSDSVADPGDAAGMVTLFDRVGVDAVVHLATRFVAQHTTDDVDDLVATNVGFTARVLEAAARTGCRHLIQTSSAWQHHEGAPYRPLSLYAATKQAAEDLLVYYRDAEDLPATVLTLFDTYGPGDERAKLVPLLIRTLQTGEPLHMSSGRQLIDLVHVSDVVRAVADLVDEGAPTGDWVLSSGRPRSVREVVELVGELAGSQVPVVFGARPDRPREMTTAWDIGAPPPGWRPLIPLAEGLADLLSGPPAAR